MPVAVRHGAASRARQPPRIRYPETPNETKLCAYIRIGMSSKQIAQMLNLSPESVNKNRYRLRKKLGLEKDTALDEIIAGL